MLRNAKFGSRYRYRRICLKRTPMLQKEVTHWIALGVTVIMLAVAIGFVLGMQSAFAETYVYVNTKRDDLAIREEPDRGSRAVFWAERGEELVLVKAGKYWSRVSRAGERGYARNDYLSNTPLPRRLTMEELLAVELE